MGFLCRSQIPFLQVIFYDIEPKLQLGNATQVRGSRLRPLLSSPPLPSPQIQKLDDLLKTADFVSLHVPLDSSTENLLNADRIAQVGTTSDLL